MSTAISGETPKITPQEELIFAVKQAALVLSCFLLLSGVFVLISYVFSGFSSEAALMMTKIMGGITGVFVAVQILNIGRIVSKILYAKYGSLVGERPLIINENYPGQKKA